MSALALPAGAVGAAYDHQQSAHCESGAISGLLRHQGMTISEPMSFGISAAMTFAYLPFVKFAGFPLFGYRMPPGYVIRGLTKRLGIRMHSEQFKSPDAGMAALDACLAQGRVVGVQASPYWLSYFPADMRFHFNAHNLVVYGKCEDRYLISDPVIDMQVECDAEALKKARFTRGVLAPKGRLYYPEFVPASVDLPRAIRSGIRSLTHVMLHTPVPLVGVAGIRMLARRVRRLRPEREHANKLLLGHVVRMQEEIGTGGAGFRYLYAFFLQEAAHILKQPELGGIADELTDAGDEWRRFALYAAKMCKGRMPMDYALLADQLQTCAGRERSVYRGLRAAVK